jgi:NAD(P)H-hydrate epimerase
VGTCLVVAGSKRYSGAALLAARGCQRAGAGMVHLAVPGSLASLAQGRLPEVIVHALGGADREDFEAKDLEALKELAGHCQAVVLGPGLGEAAGSRELARALYAEIEQPLVADADALNALSQVPVKPLAKGKRVLTPHLGEAARLLGVKLPELEKDRLLWAGKLAVLCQATVLLKGNLSLVADPSGFQFVNTSGNPGLAGAGSGDVLSGVLGALLAQGLQTLDAARLGAYVHGTAADLLADARGEIGMLAWDVAENIPSAFRELTK